MRKRTTWRWRMATVFALVVALGAGGLAPAGASAPGTGDLEGLLDIGGPDPCGLAIRLYPAGGGGPIKTVYARAIDDLGFGYRFSSVPAGDYRLRFGPELAPVCGGPAAIRWNGDAQTASLAPVLSVTDGGVVRSDEHIHQAGRIAGRLTNSDGTTLRGPTSVRAYDRNGVFATKVATASDGTYAIDFLQAGTYDVRFGEGIFVPPVWFGGTPARATSAPVVVTEGATTTANAAFL